MMRELTDLSIGDLIHEIEERLTALHKKDPNAVFEEFTHKYYIITARK